MIDVCALISNTKEEAFNLIGETTLNNYQSSSSKRGQHKRVGGKFDVDALILLTAKMDAVTQKLDKLNVSPVNPCAPSPSYNRCGFCDHITENCQVGNPFSPSHSEHVAYMNSFQPRPNHDSYFNSFNLNWK